MKRLWIGALALAGCGAGNVYDDPIPTHDDTDAMYAIRDGIKPEDQDAWQSILMRVISPMGAKVEAKTVGEAIERQKAKTACMEANDIRKMPDGPNDLGAPDYQERNSAHIEAYNKLVDGYNACLKMPV